MLAEQNPQVKNAVVRLMELSSDEKTRLVYESRHKMAWDNWGRRPRRPVSTTANLRDAVGGVPYYLRCNGAVRWRIAQDIRTLQKRG